MIDLPLVHSTTRPSRTTKAKWATHPATVVYADISHWHSVVRLFMGDKKSTILGVMLVKQKIGFRRSLLLTRFWQSEPVHVQLTHLGASENMHSLTCSFGVLELSSSVAYLDTPFLLFSQRAVSVNAVSVQKSWYVFNHEYGHRLGFLSVPLNIPDNEAMTTRYTPYSLKVGLAPSTTHESSYALFCLIL